MSAAGSRSSQRLVRWSSWAAWRSSNLNFLVSAPDNLAEPEINFTLLHWHGNQNAVEDQSFEMAPDGGYGWCGREENTNLYVALQRRLGEVG